MNAELSPEVRQASVHEIARLAEAKYVFPDVGRELARQIRARLALGSYDDIDTAGGLALELTGDLRALSNDQHWNVVHDPRAGATRGDPDDGLGALDLERLRRDNYGFARIERLEGNVGYIDLHQFAPSEHGGETAVAAMGFVACCDALIFDLRRNEGGYPSMIQLLISYLVEPEPIHINTFYFRPTGEEQQFWTWAHVPGKRMPDVPVYVLTSSVTASGAEEFAFNLKNMRRATIVGETTAGAAHPTTVETVQGLFRVWLPFGRPINPITGEDWETVGVEPHIRVPQERALKTAHLDALQQLGERRRDAFQQRDLEWEAEIVRCRYTPVAVDDSTLRRYAGRYGKWAFVVENGTLAGEHSDLGALGPLTQLGASRFLFDRGTKIEFVVDGRGEVSGARVSYRDGQPDLAVARID